MWVLVFFLLLWPQVAQAARSFEILGLAFVDPQLEIVSDQPFSFLEGEEGFLLEVSPGVTYVIYSFENLNFKPQELTVTLGTNTPLELTVVPNVSLGGSFTYEFQEKILPQTGSLRQYNFSLRHMLFQNALDFGLKFEARKPAVISLRQIKLAEFSAAQKLFQPFKDYLRTAPYSGFTVNVFPTPRIFGHSAFYYFLPIFLIILLFSLFSSKYRKATLVALVVLWLVTDFRMNYEFGKYLKKDYETWVKPAATEKSLRTYDDFYVFADWLSKNLPKAERQINFYYLDNEHFPRLLQYYLYPVRVLAKSEEAQVYVVYHRKEMKDKLLTEGAKEIVSYDEDSGIFQK